MFSHPFRNRLGLLLLSWFLVLSSTTLLAQDSLGLLNKAAREIAGRDYITAKETLEQVRRAELGPADQTRLELLRIRADYGLEKAAELRRSIARAEQLAKQNDFVKARQILEDALKSPGQDAVAQSRIRAKLAEIEVRRKQSARQIKDLFYRSVADYKAGRLRQADKGFKAVIESGVDLGFWNRRKPQKYLRKIAQRRADLPQQAPIEAPATKATIVIKAPARDEQLEPVVEVPPPPEPRPPRRVAPEPQRPQDQFVASGPTPGQTLIDTEVRRRRIITGQITFQHKIAMDHAEELVRQQNFAEARRIVREAQDALATNQSILPPPKMALMHTAAQAKLAYIAKEERTYQVAQAQAQRVRAQESAQQALARVNLERKERVKELFSQGTSYIEERNYQQALDRYIQVLSIDSNNPDARKLAGWLQDQIWLLKSQDIDRSADLEYQQLIHNVRIASKPIDRDPPLTWDPNWEAISRRRLRAGSGLSQDSPENIDASRRLGVRHPRFDYEETPLSEVFDDLRAKSGLNIIPNWQSLTAAGIEEDRPVSLRLHNVSLERALKAILTLLSSTGYYGTSVSHVIDEGVIVIATTEDLAAELKLVVYEIADLLIESREMRGGPQFEAGSGEGEAGRRRAAGAADVDVQELSADLRENIMTFVRLIEPDSWLENGGQGTVSIYGTKLIIYQTADIHAKISDMLKQIRDTRPIQISVEPRFIYVTDNFLEDIGVDFDLFLNPRGNWGGPAFRNPTLAGYPGYRLEAPPMIGTQASAGWTRPDDSGVLGSIGTDVTALTIAGSFLDALEVDFLIRATQASRQATTLMAPRVTFENAATANIYVGRQIWYVADIDLEVAENVVGYTIETDVIETGPTLNVGGVVSPDRRFVRLEVEVILYDLFSLDFLAELLPEEFFLGSVLGWIQLPQIDTSTITTQVSVPDGGALLIGGLRRRVEETLEAGVPILNKIPWIKRFFSNKSIQDDKAVLVILLRPRIIDLMEEQGLVHPSLGER